MDLFDRGMIFFPLFCTVAFLLVCSFALLAISSNSFPRRPCSRSCLAQALAGERRGEASACPGWTWPRKHTLCDVVSLLMILLMI